jgi:transcription elongation factor Elf1
MKGRPAMENKRVVKLNPEDLENVSGGEIYGKPVGDHFETWFRCPKCNQYETMIYAHSNDGHMMKKMVLTGTFCCEKCGYKEKFNIEYEF